MPASEPAYGMIALAVAVLILIAILAVSVKVRMLSARRSGVRIYDFGADLKLAPALHSRSYQIALYLTMKSLPRDGGEPQPPLSASSR